MKSAGHVHRCAAIWRRNSAAHPENARVSAEAFISGESSAISYSMAVRKDSQARAAADSGNNISRPLGECSMICRHNCNSCSRCNA